MNWALFAVAGYTALASLAYITLIGKPREPVTPGMAVIVTGYNAGLVVLLVLAGLRLMR